MSAVNNPVLGYRECPDCDERATVHMARRKGNGLYQRCGCGCVQSTGRLVQSRLWYETDWMEGCKPASIPEAVLPFHDYEKELARMSARIAARVPGQSDRAGQENQGAAGTEELGQNGDFDPTKGPVVEPIEPKAKKKAGGLFLVLAVGAGLLVAGLRA